MSHSIYIKKNAKAINFAFEVGMNPTNYVEVLTID
jgi:hypothetical protein